MIIGKHAKTPFSVKAGLLIGLSLLVVPALAQIINPPRVHWIGPERSCDYRSIQEALDDIFSCGFVVCPPGTNELRLSANYDHSGQVVVNKTFDIRGGFATCKAPFDGNNYRISAGPAGGAVFLIRPGSASIRNVLSDLTMEGGTFRSSLGGVISMQAGDATLRLSGSTVTMGNADSGGGIYMAGGGNRLEMVSSIIENSQATKGGGVYCTNGGVIDFQAGRIEDNFAELSGGGIYLQGGCHLLGRTAGKNRQILRNVVTDSQQGQGAGVFARASTIEMGALNSRSRFEENSVRTQPLHDYEAPGDNRGGGLHLEFADATLYNTWFRGNQAADGGAISATGDSTLLVDRYSGPCDPGDTGNSPDCSLFEFNRALGGEDDDGDEGGDGAVLYTVPSLGVVPHATINRSVMRLNAASCPEDGSPTGGECDIDSFVGIGVTNQSIVSHADEGSNSEIALVGNLFYGNSIGDDDDCSFPEICYKYGFHFVSLKVFNENTVAANEHADAIFGSTRVRGTTGTGDLIGNVIWHTDSGEGVTDDTNRIIFGVSSCNISNFADQLDDAANSIPVFSLDEDPLFINPGPVTSPDADFRVQVPDSPALDRCDDQGGRLTLNYDIVGNPRPMNIPGVANGAGQRDAGAFEALPGGTVNQTTDLVINIISDAPKTAELFESHAFTIDVTNTGRNSPAAFAVALDFDGFGSLETLTAPNASGTGEPVWDCDVGRARCDALGGLVPGGATVPITATISYDIQGLKTVTAAALMQDTSLAELTPDNNMGSDTVTVGPGADLALTVFSASPGEVLVNEPQGFLIVVENKGPAMVSGARVHLDLASSGGQLESFNAAGWNCNPTTAICTSLSLDPNASAPVLTANIRYSEPGQKVQTATVTASDGTGDPNPNNNSDSDFVTVIELVEDVFSDGFED